MRPKTTMRWEVLVAMTALGVAGGCSLGTGVTPTCSLESTDPATACDPLPKCDDGKGGLLATEECCLLRANDEYNLACMAENAAGNDYRGLCGLSGPGPAGCCNSAKAAYDACLKAK